MRAAVSPTNWRSIPRSVMMFFSTSALIPSGNGKTTSWENPSVNIKFFPERETRYPMPFNSRRFKNPSVTPEIIFAMLARVVPHNARSKTFSSSTTFTATVLPVSLFSTTIETCGCATSDNVPFGPLTVIVCPTTVTSTFAEIGINFFPMRDIGGKLGNFANNFAAEPARASFFVCHKSVRRGNDSYAIIGHHSWKILDLCIDSMPWFADALNVLKAWLVFGVRKLDAKKGLLYEKLLFDGTHI